MVKATRELEVNSNTQQILNLIEESNENRKEDDEEGKGKIHLGRFEFLRAAEESTDPAAAALEDGVLEDISEKKGDLQVEEGNREREKRK